MKITNEIKSFDQFSYSSDFINGLIKINLEPYNILLTFKDEDLFGLLNHFGLDNSKQEILRDYFTKRKILSVVEHSFENLCKEENFSEKESAYIEDFCYNLFMEEPEDSWLFDVNNQREYDCFLFVFEFLKTKWLPMIKTQISENLFDDSHYLYQKDFIITKERTGDIKGLDFVIHGDLHDKMASTVLNHAENNVKAITYTADRGGKEYFRLTSVNKEIDSLYHVMNFIEKIDLSIKKEDQIQESLYKCKETLKNLLSYED